MIAEVRGVLDAFLPIEFIEVVERLEGRITGDN
jgi:hypothetical protein